MKVEIRFQKVEGFYGPVINGGKWLFVKGIRAKGSYPIARIVDGQAVEVEATNALHSFTNAELVEAFLAVSK